MPIQITPSSLDCPFASHCTESQVTKPANNARKHLLRSPSIVVSATSGFAHNNHRCRHTRSQPQSVRAPPGVNFGRAHRCLCPLYYLPLSCSLASHPSGPHHISIDPLHTKPIHPTLPTSDSLITDFTLLCPSRYFTPSPRPQHEEPLPAHPPAPAPRRPPVGLGWVQGSPLPLPLLGEIQQAAVFCFAGGNYASKPNKLILQCIAGNRWSNTNKLIRQRHKN